MTHDEIDHHKLELYKDTIIVILEIESTGPKLYFSFPWRVQYQCAKLGTRRARNCDLLITNLGVQLSTTE